jgi:NRPS condensation-like uncharacterized protein
LLFGELFETNVESSSISIEISVDLREKNSEKLSNFTNPKLFSVGNFLEPSER